MKFILLAWALISDDEGQVGKFVAMAGPYPTLAACQKAKIPGQPKGLGRACIPADSIQGWMPKLRDPRSMHE